MPRLNVKDFLAGFIFLAFGSAFLVLAQHYPMGSARRMGPGYFPQLLALLLMGIGIAAMLRAWARAPVAIGGIASKALVLVTVGVLIFGLTVERWGLVVASVSLVLISSAASSSARLGQALALAFALGLFCATVFGLLLGLPFPILRLWG